MYCVRYLKITFSLCWIQISMCMNLGYLSDGDIAQMLNVKGYLPEDKDLPKPSVVKTSENDATYILSKLSDKDLIKLLSEFPSRGEYGMDDLLKVSEDLKTKQREDLGYGKEVSVQNEPQSPVFRLENQEVDPYVVNKDVDPKYIALQKLNNMLYSRPREEISAENDEKKEIIFDILVAQLKTLCCKKNKLKKFNKVASKIKGQIKKRTEYIFLVLNEEIKSNASDELIPVDPDSLSENSSVLLLGPITNPLSEIQTKLVISRLTNELSKPEYLSLLKKVSEGSLENKHSDLMKSIIAGPETRRYIKPHRCNHQSKLTKIYGGPKWIICTGYLNINTPSLYD